MPDIRPTLDELATLMRARTQGTLSLQGEFNTDTLPTADQAESTIDIAQALVLARLGDTVPDNLVSAAEKAILFKAAALVEVTYYPEQANDDSSAYSLYQAQFEELRDALIAAIDGNQPNQARFASVPTYGRNGYDPDNPPV